MKVLLALFVILTGVSQGVAQGQPTTFTNQKASEVRCRDYLQKSGRLNGEIILPLLWLDGFYSGKNGDVPNFVTFGVVTKSQLIGPPCLKEPEQLLITLIEDIRKNSKTSVAPTKNAGKGWPHVQEQRLQNPITEMTCRDIGWTKESFNERGFIFEAGAFPQLWLDGYLAGKQNFERTMGELMDLVNSVRPLRNACHENDEQKLLDIRQKSLK